MQKHRGKYICNKKSNNNCRTRNHIDVGTTCAFVYIFPIFIFNFSTAHSYTTTNGYDSNSHNHTLLNQNFFFKKKDNKFPNERSDFRHSLLLHFIIVFFSFKYSASYSNINVQINILYYSCYYHSNIGWFCVFIQFNYTDLFLYFEYTGA